MEGPKAAHSVAISLVGIFFQILTRFLTNLSQLTIRGKKYVVVGLFFELCF